MSELNTEQLTAGDIVITVDDPEQAALGSVDLDSAAPVEEVISAEDAVSTEDASLAGSDDVVIDFPDEQYTRDWKELTQLDKVLEDWILHHEKNGIVQHSDEWLAAKRFVVGGSKIAMVEGSCPYSCVSNYVREKAAGIHFKLGIAAQWGNLMEEIIKQQVEHDYECVVLGENIYITDPAHTGVAYSPDGLAVMNVGARGSCPKRGGSLCNMLEGDSTPARRIVLLEFKCPWSRIPDGTPPSNYVPQVKMGLDMIKIAELGLLAEAVYRRCTVAQLENDEFIDSYVQNTKNAIRSPRRCIKSGIIGVFVDAHPITTHNNLYDAWPDWYQKIQDWRRINGADFGKMPSDMFETLMDAIDRHDLSTWYPHNGNSAKHSAREFMESCKGCGVIPLGIIPWKLIRIDYHWIAPEHGYIEKIAPRIELINTAVINAVNNPRDAHNILNDFDTEWEALTGVSASSRGSRPKQRGKN